MVQMSIYSQILCGHLKQQLFSPQVQRSAVDVVQAAIALHHKMVHNFLPTAIKFHYTFNLRDISSVFQVVDMKAHFSALLRGYKLNSNIVFFVFKGILLSGPESVKESNDLAMLWLHESSRVYSDRLVDVHDIKRFQKLQMETVRECFEVLTAFRSIE